MIRALVDVLTDVWDRRPAKPTTARPSRRRSAVSAPKTFPPCGSKGSEGRADEVNRYRPLVAFPGDGAVACPKEIPRRSTRLPAPVWVAPRSPR